MPAGLGFMVHAIFGMMGSQSLLYVGALSVRLSEGFLVLMAVCSVINTLNITTLYAIYHIVVRALRAQGQSVTFYCVTYYCVYIYL